MANRKRPFVKNRNGVMYTRAFPMAKPGLNYEFLFYQALAISGGYGVSPNSSIQYARKVAMLSCARLARTQKLNAGWQSGLPDDFSELVYWLCANCRIYDKMSNDQLLLLKEQLNFAILQAPRNQVIDLLTTARTVERESLGNNLLDVLTPKSQDGSGVFQDLGDTFQDFIDKDGDGLGFFQELFDGDGKLPIFGG